MNRWPSYLRCAVSALAAAWVLALPASALAEPRSAKVVLAKAGDDRFAMNTAAFLAKLNASDTIELTDTQVASVSKRDKEAFKTISLILVKQSSEVAKKTISVAKTAGDVYDVLVTTTGPCDDVNVCSKIQTRECAVRWIRDTLAAEFKRQMDVDSACAPSLLNRLLSL